MTKRAVGNIRTVSSDRGSRTAERAMGRTPLILLLLVLAGPATAQVPAPTMPAPTAPASPLDSYADAATTTIIAEQSCPGVRMKAGQLTNLRLAARINTGQEPVLQEKLRTRATQVRQQLAEVGRDAWCANAMAAFGPTGTVAKGVLVPSGFVR